MLPLQSHTRHGIGHNIGCQLTSCATLKRIILFFDFLVLVASFVLVAFLVLLNRVIRNIGCIYTTGAPTGKTVHRPLCTPIRRMHWLVLLLIVLLSAVAQKWRGRPVVGNGVSSVDFTWRHIQIVAAFIIEIKVCLKNENN